MITINSIAALREKIDAWKREGFRIAFVPTMGNLHAGHLSLIERVCAQNTKVVASIFVNPMQFGENEDFATYPRTLEDDSRALSRNGVDLLFAPEAGEIYPAGLGATTCVTPPDLANKLEGESRPGFFTGVATVVNKLFNIVQPDVACFGEKDYQQLLVIKQMVADLAMSVEIVSSAIVREQDGLAMSSRNHYLSDSERETAAKLNVCLQHVVDEMKTGADCQYVVMHATQELENHGFTVDYVVIRRQQDLTVPSADDTRLVVLAAAWLGRTRLIDNRVFTRAG